MALSHLYLIIHKLLTQTVSYDKQRFPYILIQSIEKIVDKFRTSASIYLRENKPSVGDDSIHRVRQSYRPSHENVGHKS